MRLRALAVFLLWGLFSTSASAQKNDIGQHLRDQYQGKVFVLRGFPTGDRLLYDSSGSPQNAASGDWTVDGFVQVSDIRLSGDRLIIKAQRMAVAWLDRRQFEFRPLERRKGNNGGNELARVEIKADAGMRDPSALQVAALVSKIFLTAQDSLANLVPDYWKLCMRGGLDGKDNNCAFAPLAIAVPGVRGSDDNYPAGTAPDDEPSGNAGLTFHVGKGVTPPHQLHNREPEFSDAARAAKYQGTVLLSLVVSKEGAPINVRITRPLGYGLDAKAVEAVETWKFAPAEKDGQPVPVQIAVEVEFRLY